MLSIAFTSVAAVSLAFLGGNYAEPQATPSPTPAAAKASTSTAPVVAPLLDLDIRHQVISVDMTAKTASPSVLTVNLATGDSISLRLVNAGGETPKTTLEVGNRSDTAEGTDVLVQFRDCKTASAREFAAFIRHPVADFCPLHVMTTDHALIAFLGASKDGDSAHIVVSGTDKNGHPSEVGIGIRVVRRHWSVAFSSGFVGFGGRDHRYNARPIAGDDKNKTLERVSDGGQPYSLGVLAHYDVATLPVALAFGFGTDVPVKELSVMAGISLKLRTLPLGQSGYLTGGYALKPFSRLSPSLESTFGASDPAKRLVPAAMTEAALTERKMNGTWFAAFTFVFAGKGESEFSGRIAK